MAGLCSNEDARDYDRVKATFFQCYDINEETYVPSMIPDGRAKREQDACRVGHSSLRFGGEVAERLWG